MDVDSLQSIAEEDATFNYTSTSFNRQTNQLNVSYSITNNGVQSIGDGSLAVFGALNPISVSLNGAEGNVAGASFFVLDSELPSGSLATGQTSNVTDFKFDNPQRSRFGFVDFILAEGNQAPVFESAPVVVASADSPYQYAAIASDPNGQTLTYSLASAPSGLTINPATGLVTWTPTAGDIAEHSVTVVADDGEGGVTSQSFTLSVVSATPTNRAPVFITADSSTHNVSSGTLDLEIQTSAIDPEGDALTYAVSGQPAGLSINPANGLITGTVDSSDVGDFNFEITATDAAGNTTIQQYQLSVVQQAVGCLLYTSPSPRD